ncbi:MAG: MATE family efflux transporter [Coprobacter sp.]|nr:MATE family efflux transporter [Coprobacter sp.]
MRFNKINPDNLSAVIRNSREIGWKQRLYMVVTLSIPAIISQVSAIFMEYIDASMVGSLGADASAAIGLVATTTWLFMGLSSAVAIGFSVQVAHLLGAGKPEEARSVLRQALVATMTFSLLLASSGCAVSHHLPIWLGGKEAITGDASTYFLIFSFFLPALQYHFLAGGMLRCSGNMLVPGMVGVLMCVLDVAFNFLLIFPSTDITLFGLSFTLPRAGLGVKGAALGTALAETTTTIILLSYLWFRGRALRLAGTKGSFRPQADCLKRAFKIGMPVGIERMITTAAQITLTAIVAPLGICSLAANSLAITAESICYMPGYGIGEAGTTLVGQSLGAGRKVLARQFAYTTVGMGMAVMTIMGIVMYIAAPLMIGVMTPDPEVLALGVKALRTEAFAEPMFAASIVAYGVFVGAGDTVVPSIMNLGSIWIVRVTLAALLAPTLGLHGVWIAMCAELCFRGVIFLVRLQSGRWMNRIDKLK